MRFLFIVNPKSGRKRKKKIEQNIEKFLLSDDYKIIYWEDAEHDIELSIKENLDDFDIVVAVGGDGTVNKVAQAIHNSHATLAIIPSGSGNGLARHLGIPLKMKRAVKALTTGQVKSIDTCTVNDQLFLSVCGVGFDAQVSYHFANSVRRGLLSYAAIVLKKFRKFSSEEFEIEINDRSISRDAFIITFANSNQFGNNFIIAPEADLQDGIMRVVIVKKFPLYKALNIGIRILRKRIHKSRYVETIPTQSIVLKRKSPGVVQYDGEPINMDSELKIQILPASMKVLLPN